jgi:hypothetical protein
MYFVRGTLPIVTQTDLLKLVRSSLSGEQRLSDHEPEGGTKAATPVVSRRHLRFP